MAQVSTNEFKPGIKVEIDNQPYLIVSNEFVKPGKGHVDKGIQGLSERCAAAQGDRRARQRDHRLRNARPERLGIEPAHSPKT